MLRRVDTDQRRGGIRGWREELQTGCGNDAERAFGADEQGFHVVAGVVLAQALEGREYAAVRKHHLEAQHQVAHHAVAKHRGSPRIGRQIAADLGRALGAQTQWKEAVRLARCRLRLGKRTTRLDDHRIVGGVDLTDTVQPAQGQNDLRPRFIGRGAAAVAGIAPVRHHRDRFTIANAQDLGDFVDVVGQQHQRRGALVYAPNVDQERRYHIRRLEPGPLPDGRLELP